jgi:hypothetical protein
MFFLRGPHNVSGDRVSCERNHHLSAMSDESSRQRLAVAAQVEGVVGWLPLTKVAYRM